MGYFLYFCFYLREQKLDLLQHYQNLVFLEQKLDPLKHDQLLVFPFHFHRYPTRDQL